MTTIKMINNGDRVRYDAPDGTGIWFEGEVVGPAINGYDGWFSVLVSSSGFQFAVGERRDFAGYALRPICSPGATMGAI